MILVLACAPSGPQPEMMLEGENPGDMVGFSLVMADDLLVTGMPLFGATEDELGSGAVARVDQTGLETNWWGESPHDMAGADLHTVGPWLAVGARHARGVGRVYLVDPQASGPLEDADIVLEGEQVAGHFGIAVSAVGEAVVVGAHLVRNDVTFGAVSIIHPLTGNTTVFESDGGENFMGVFLEGVGDVTGDGIDDLMVGTPRLQTNDGPRSVAVLLSGEQTGTTQLISDVTLERYPLESSTALAFAGCDLMGTGLPQAIIGASGDDTVYLFEGDDVTQYRGTGRFGHALACTEDGEVLVGAPEGAGGVTLIPWEGPGVYNTKPLVTGPEMGSDFGASLATGSNRWAVGAPGLEGQRGGVFVFEGHP